jgi:two-component system, OmpR family, sensor kinase
MSHRRTPDASALLGRLQRAQLRVKVMAGVVVVTLVALVAFDVGAVTVMRRYLLSQTDSNLQVALTLTQPRLAGFLTGGALGAVGAGAARAVGSGGLRQQQSGQVVAKKAVSFSSVVPALPGAFDMVFVPLRGKQVTLQEAAGGSARVAGWTLSSGAAQVAAASGPHTLVGAGGQTNVRVDSLRVKGGSLVAGTSLGQVYETIVQVELIVIFGSIAVVLLIGLGVFVVLRRGLRPIEAMAAQADRITAGDLTDRVALQHPRSEVGRLGAALNGMLARIETGVRERESSQRQMRRFFADASHELRTPLASLRANAELYQQGALRSPDDLDEVMDRIVLETRRMGRLVDDMLRLARLGQHPVQSREPVDLTAVVSGCADRVRVADPMRAWETSIPNGLVVTGDEELLRRAVDNLLMNVLVHTPRDTVGAITVSAADGRISIEVSDDGPGVPADTLPHIFERFYRVGSRPTLYLPDQPAPTDLRDFPDQRAPTDLPAGSGLGLAIAAEIASAHGGAAHAAPAFPHGLRITLTLPVRRPSDQRRDRELAASAS